MSQMMAPRAEREAWVRAAMRPPPAHENWRDEDWMESERIASILEAQEQGLDDDYWRDHGLEPGRF